MKIQATIAEIFAKQYWLSENFNFQCIFRTFTFMNLKSLQRWIITVIFRQEKSKYEEKIIFIAILVIGEEQSWHLIDYLVPPGLDKTTLFSAEFIMVCQTNRIGLSIWSIAVDAHYKRWLLSNQTFQGKHLRIPLRASKGHHLCPPLIVVPDPIETIFRLSSAYVVSPGPTCQNSVLSEGYRRYLALGLTSVVGELVG